MGFMGITRHCAGFLIDARSSGVRFGRTLTIGHQLMFVSPKYAAGLLKQHKLWPAGLSDAQVLMTLTQKPSWVDGWLKFLGAESVDVMDYSDFEGANVVHDLNKPLPDSLCDQYDVVIDSGTIEHVFDIKTVLSNYMKLVRPGGSLILMTVANNFCGHGFYQYSPELFPRLFCKENGYELKRMVMAEDEVVVFRLAGLRAPISFAGRAYDVVDPALVRDRVELVNSRQTVIMILAVKQRTVPLFTCAPQQSDYAAVWQRGTTSGELPGETGLKARLRTFFNSLSAGTFLELQHTWLPGIMRFGRWLLPKRGFGYSSFGNRRFYQRVRRVPPGNARS